MRDVKEMSDEELAYEYDTRDSKYTLEELKHEILARMARGKGE